MNTKDLDTYSTEDEGSYDLPNTQSWSMDQQDSRSESSRFTPRCLVKFVCLPLIALAVVSALLAHFLGGGEGSPFDLDLDLFRGEDPTDGETYVWRQANGRGLELTLINALDPIWHPYFETAVQQWDSGDPDSLTLRTIVRDPDPDCTPQAGYLKCCNGDFGAVDWKGVNLLFLQNGFIYQSIAKMNEYFHNPNEDEKKQVSWRDCSTRSSRNARSSLLQYELDYFSRTFSVLVAAAVYNVSRAWTWLWITAYG